MTSEQAVTSRLRAENFAMLNSIETVSVITGQAQFLNPHTLHVTIADGAATLTVAAQHILIGTGSQPVIPDIPGLRASTVVTTSTDLLATPTLPPRLVVLGGGYVGLESARRCRRLTAPGHGARTRHRSSARKTTTSRTCAETSCGTSASRSSPAPRSAASKTSTDQPRRCPTTAAISPDQSTPTYPGGPGPATRDGRPRSGQGGGPRHA